MLFGINELAIHHDDVAVAAGRRYAPPPETLAVLSHMWRSRNGVDAQDWDAIIGASGRLP